MEKEQELMLRQALLEQELESVRNQLKIVRLFKSEQQKELSSPSSSMSKEENVGVQNTEQKEVVVDFAARQITTNVTTSSSEQQTVNTVPSSSQKQTGSIPEQTAPGKESSNPLMADNLPKVVNEVQTSRTLVTPSDFTLKPNGGIPIPEKTKDSPLASPNSEKGIQKPKKDYYVVFNGPNAGIYEDWDITKKATDGVPNIQHKKYKTFLQARTSADIYTRTKMLPPLHFVSSAEGLRPNNFVEALKTKNKKQVSIGRLPTNDQKKIKEDESTEDIISEELLFQHFEYCYRTAREASEEDFVTDYFFTTDGKNLSHYNFVQNANPEQVYEAFQMGLVKQIYPSINLQELSHFPKPLLAGIKNFRKKCAKPGADIFLKITSSIPVWNNNDELVYAPHHIIQIGISKEINYHPSQKMKALVEKQEFNELAKRRFEDFCQKAFSFFADSKIFVNYCSNRKLIYSKISKKISGDDDHKFFIFQKSILHSTVFGAHHEDICRILKKYGRDQYGCTKCFPAKNESSINNEKTEDIISLDPTMLINNGEISVHDKS